MRRKIEGGVGALRESDDTNYLKPNGQSRNLDIYAIDYNDITCLETLIHVPVIHTLNY